MSLDKFKVFITNRGSHDYTDAEQFGELIYCSDGVIGKYNTSQMTRIFQEAFANSIDRDYILLTSLTTLCSIACAVFAAKHGCLNLLIFKDNRYVMRRVVLK